MLNAQATFDRTFGVHGVKAMVGYQQEDYRQDWHEGYREVYAFPDYPVLNAGGEENQKATGSATEYALQSVFGRLNYDYMEKYLFEANLRYDGSSRFAKGHKWGAFPSFSVGWRLSEESFWEPVRDVVNNLKIRASWGQLGNQNIGNYPFASNVTLSNIKYVFDKSVYSGAAIVNMANSLISWETTTTTDAGLDITLLGKLNINADYYYRVTDDILLGLAIPRILGLNAPQQNAGKVENRGWGLGFTWADRAGDFSYRASFNLSDVKNKVLDLKGIDETGLTVNREGYPMYSLYGLEAIGYIQPEDYDAGGKYTGAAQYGNFGPGDIKYRDQLTVDSDGDGVMDMADGVINTSDRVVMGGTIPRYTFGLDLYGEYRGFDLNLLFQGVGKANGYIYDQGVQSFIYGGSVLEMHKDYWTPENRNARFPRFAFNENNNIQNSSFWIKNAAYVRLKNLQFGYSIPRKALSKAQISNLRLYVSADNVFTVSDFWKQYDVEAPVGNGSFYPILRNVSFGVDFRF
jgi:TonB-linked SusC/RagA family outer membrane protein